MDALAFSGPFEPLDPQIREDGGVTERDQKVYRVIGIPGGGRKGAGDDGIDRSVGGIFSNFIEDIAEHIKGTEHSDHYESDIDQAAGSLDGFGIGDPADDSLTQGKVDGAANDGCQETYDVSQRGQYNVVVLIAYYHDDCGHQQDHKELNGEAAAHDRPIGGGRYA